MSRHTHEVERDGTKYLVAYGYDWPLTEYFLSVLDIGKDDEDDDHATLFAISSHNTMVPHPDKPTQIHYPNSEILELMKEWECPPEATVMVEADLPY